jgi:LCP family protein required for cell wall assembly
VPRERTASSSLGLAMRSTLFPGWGQLAANRRRLGKTLILFTGLLLVAGLAVFLFVDPVEVAVWLADPDILLMVVLGNIVIAAVRLFATGHAWWAGGGHGWVAAILLALFVAIPHVAVAWVGLETRDSMVEVFSPTAAPVTPTSTTTSTTTTTTLRIDRSIMASAPGQLGDDEPAITRGEAWRPFGEERLNILLLGGDAGPGRGGLRTDTMIVASVDPVSGDAALVGVPRNYGMVELSDGSTVPVRQLGHVYGWGRSHPDRFDGIDPGASAVVDAVSFITGLDIDHFVLVDLTGFADLVDVLGGVRLDVPRAVDAPLYNPVTGGYEMIEIRPGPQTLDGGRALAYARARYGSSDYARMARQRCILASLATQTDPLELLTRLGGVLDVVEESVTTDLPLDQAPDLVRLLLEIDARRMTVVGFDSTWSVGWTDTGNPIPDVPRIREAVRKIIESPGGSDLPTGSAANEACG